MQDDMDAMHRSRRERPTFTATGAPEMSIKVVDVGRRELGDGEVAEVGFQMMVDQALRLADRARRPVTRCRGEPSFEEIGDAARVDAGVVDIFEKPFELPASLSLTATHRPSDPPLSPARGIDSRVHAQLPAIRTASSNGAGHGPTLRGMAN